MANRIFYSLLVFMLAPALLAAGADQCNAKVINARSAILVDSSGAVLFEQNADASIPPASITKLLTLYLTFEAIEGGRCSLMDMVRVSSNAASAPPSRMGLRAGEKVSVAELIKGTGIVSGNDAAVALAEHVGGSERNFVALLNIKARQLGMLNSHFANPNGLPASTQLTTARDIARLSIAYLRRFPEALDIHSLKSYTYHKVTRRNANKLLSRCPGVDGLKTGFVNASRYNISATAVRNGKRLIAVVMGAATPSIRTTETTRLLEYGFTGSFPTVSIVAKNTRERGAKKSTTVAKKSKRSKAKKHAKTTSNKIASAQKAKSTKAGTAASSVKKKSSSKKAKQTTIAKKTDRSKESSVKRSQQKSKGKAAVQDKNENVSKSKNSTSPPKS